MGYVCWSSRGYWRFSVLETVQCRSVLTHVVRDHNVNGNHFPEERAVLPIVLRILHVHVNLDLLLGWCQLERFSKEHLRSLGSAAMCWKVVPMLHSHSNIFFILGWDGLFFNPWIVMGCPFYYPACFRDVLLFAWFLDTCHGCRISGNEGALAYACDTVVVNVRGRRLLKLKQLLIGRLEELNQIGSIVRQQRHSFSAMDVLIGPELRSRQLKLLCHFLSPLSLWASDWNP